MVPVLRNADTLGLREIRTGSEAIVEAARKGKLTSTQLTGGTFTISNLGMYGVKAVRRDPQPARRSASSPSEPARSGRSSWATRSQSAP